MFFSAAWGNPPPSLKNIFKELKEDLDIIKNPNKRWEFRELGKTGRFSSKYFLNCMCGTSNVT